MSPEELRNRTKNFAYRIIRLYRTLPKTAEAEVIGKQILRSATSVAANYRAATRARSRAEFIAKLGLVVEEADETLFWLECIADNAVLKQSLMAVDWGSERISRNIHRGAEDVQGSCALKS
jgi:four helix bundle protein